MKEFTLMSQSRFKHHCESVSEFYDRVADDYDAHRRNRYHDYLDDQILNIIKHHHNGDRLLEAGCGTGRILNRISTLNLDPLGMDFSRNMIQITSDAGFRSVKGDIQNVPFQTNTFNTVLALRVLPHVPNPMESLCELSRITRPGGMVIIDFYNMYSLRYVTKKLSGMMRRKQIEKFEDPNVKYFTKKILSEMIPDNLTVIARYGLRTVIPFGSCLEIPFWGSLFIELDRYISNTWISKIAGFQILVLQKSKI